MVRRRALFTAFAASGAALATESPALAAYDNTVVDLSRGLGNVPFGAGRNLSATPNSWRYGEATYAALTAHDLQRIRVWLRFGKTVDLVSTAVDYAKWYEYLDFYEVRAHSLVDNWQADYDPLVTG